MPHILPSIACNLDTNILLASLPLFESEQVKAIEWSFDSLFKMRDIPDWFVELLHAFSKEQKLMRDMITDTIQWKLKVVKKALSCLKDIDSEQQQKLIQYNKTTYEYELIEQSK